MIQGKSFKLQYLFLNPSSTELSRDIFPSFILRHKSHDLMNSLHSRVYDRMAKLLSLDQ